jgi:hypothetical protein
LHTFGFRAVGAGLALSLCQQLVEAPYLFGVTGFEAIETLLRLEFQPRC